MKSWTARQINRRTVENEAEPVERPPVFLPGDLLQVVMIRPLHPEDQLRFSMAMDRSKSRP